jgi:RHS repeat-associated protein
LLAVVAFAAFPAKADQFQLKGTFGVGQTGAATYSIPITVPPGTHGMEPSLSLEYGSQLPNGILGLGWQLKGLPAIARCPQTLAQDNVYGKVTYDDINHTDRFCMDGQRLVQVDNSGNPYGTDQTYYRTERDNYSLIELHAGANGPAWFEVHTKDGMVMYFGMAPDATTQQTSSQVPVQGLTTIRTWYLGEVKDTANNYYTLFYAQDTTNGSAHISKINYTGNSAKPQLPYNSVQFFYETRPDAVPFYQAGHLIEDTQRLTDIKTFNGSSLVLDYKLGYQLSGPSGRSELTDVTLLDTNGNCLLADSSGNCQHAASFTWQGQAVPFDTHSTSVPTGYSTDSGGKISYLRYLSGNFGGSGREDLVSINYNTGEANLCVAPPSGVYSCNAITFSGLPKAISAYTAVVGDWDGDGVSDLALYEGGGTVYFYLSTGSGFSPIPFTLTNAAQKILIGDFNGDGRSDLLFVPATGNASIYLASGSALSGYTFTKKTGFSPQWNSTAGDFVILGDFDGDGRTDVAYYVQDVTYPSNSFTYYLGPDLSASGTITYQSKGTVPTFFTPIVGDWNGDGKADIVLVPNVSTTDGAQFFLSTGLDFVKMSFNPDWNTNYGNTSFPIGDFNGDGKTDIVANGQLWTADGTSFNSVATLPTGSLFSLFNQFMAPDEDPNGDGATDYFVRPNYNSANYVLYYTTYSADLVWKFTTGLGADATITYSPLDRAAIYTKGTAAQYPTEDVQSPLYVVSKVQANAGITDANGNWITYDTKYTYTGAQADLHGRGFLGFTSIDAYDLQTLIHTTTSYNLLWPSTGLVAETQRTHGSITLSDTVETYATRALGGVKQVLLVDSLFTGNDLDGTALPQIETKQALASYDYCGNLSSATGNSGWTTTTSGDGYSTVTTNTYTVASTGQAPTTNIDCFWDQLNQQLVKSSTPEPKSATKTTTFGYDPASGLLSQTIQEPSSSTITLETDYNRDTFGNIIARIWSGDGFTGRAERRVYEANGRFIKATYKGLAQNNPGGISPYYDQYTYDPKFGGLMQHIDPNQGLTKWDYDGFGRKIDQIDPDQVVTTWAYHSAIGCPLLACLVQKKVTATDSTGATVVVEPEVDTFYDILERKVFSASPSFDGKNTIVNDLTYYDALGRIQSIARPYQGTDTPQATTYTYDVLGRPFTETRPDSSKVTYSYTHQDYQHDANATDFPNAGYTTATLSGSNITARTTSTVRDSRNQIIGLVDPLNKNTGKSTGYVYDPFGNLEQLTDLEGNVTTMSYDVRNNMRTLHDPDRGNWSFIPDGLGEVIQQTDAIPQTTTFTYDLLQRPKQRVEWDITSNWTYDPTNGIGKLATACTTNLYAATNCNSGANYSRSQAYDSLSRPTTTTTTIGGASYNTTIGYDPTTGKTSSITYPSNFVATYLYNANGYLTTLKNGPTGVALWKADQRDAELHLKHSTFSSGVTTQQSFDPATGLVTGITTGPSDSSNFQSLGYSWDMAGNLTSRADWLNSVGETFTYDLDDRLKQSVLGSTTRNYAYSPSGNLTCKPDLGACTAASPNFLYNGPKPHGVSDIVGTVNNGTGTGGSTTNPSYSYDANGNMTSGGGRLIAYSAANLPTHIWSGSVELDFEYDDSRARFRQVAPEGTTLYIQAAGVLTEQYAPPTGAVWRDYLYANGDMVGVRTVQVAGGTPTWRYFHKDHLGSIAAVSAAVGTLIEQDAYDAWGKPRCATASDPHCTAAGADDPNDLHTSVVTRGFTDQEQLQDVGLLHLNGRVYDPQIGKFTGTDPLVAHPYTAQGWNRFAYVSNNPLRYTDPTGEADDQVEDAASKTTTGGQTDAAQNTGTEPASVPGFTPATAAGGSGQTTPPPDQPQGGATKLEEVVVPGHKHEVASPNLPAGVMVVADCLECHTPDDPFALGRSFSDYEKQFLPPPPPVVQQQSKTDDDKKDSGSGSKNAPATGKADADAAPPDGPHNDGEEKKPETQTTQSDGSVKLTKGGEKTIGNLAGDKDKTVQEVLTARGGTGRNLKALESGMGDKKLGDVANAAAKGDQAAQKALKMVKQAGTKGQRTYSK